jgi:hypothetical protein
MMINGNGSLNYHGLKRKKSEETVRRQCGLRPTRRCDSSLYFFNQGRWNCSDQFCEKPQRIMRRVAIKTTIIIGLMMVASGHRRLELCEMF